MVYTIDLISSHGDSSIAISSENLISEDIDNVGFVKSLRYLSSGKKDVISDINYLIVGKYWLEVLQSFINSYTKVFPKLNEVLSFIRTLKDGDCIAIVFNQKLDILEWNKIICKIKGKENNVSSDQLFEDFTREHSELFSKYRPLAYDYSKLLRFGTQNRKDRVCRYCGKSMPEVTFKKNAHTISHALGNVSYITNDECDTCNSIFGNTIEQEFVNYISVYRTIAASKMQAVTNHPTKFSSFELAARVDHAKLALYSKEIYKIEKSENQISVYHNAGKINFLYVYKALVKFVIGMLPFEELQYFKETIHWLTGDIEVPLYDFKRTIYQDAEEHPFINMFFRISDKERIPYLIAELHVYHLEFLFIVPGCSKDIITYDRNSLDQFLSIRKDINMWETINMQCNLDKDMIFKVNIPREQKNEDT